MATSRRLPRPEWGEHPRPDAVYGEAARRFEAGRPDEALRVLSSIVEESPRDARALRLAGFALMGWGRYEEAAALFARTRRLRPFEPQATLCEALALEAQGRAGEAALGYEIVLAGRFDGRTERFAKDAAARLYLRLLRGIGKAGLARARDLGERWSEGGGKHGDARMGPGGHELMLFWSIDDCDVDLHVTEAGGPEVFYSAPVSSSGGRLHWDNTGGLGPEVYTHPSREPAEAFVHYFGASGVDGTVPAATLLLSFAVGDARTAVVPRAAVLRERSAKVVLFRSAAD